MSDRPTIWLFRDPEPRDAYTAAFNRAGYSVRHIGVLRFEYLTEWEPVPDADALVLTSRRAVEALSRVPDLAGRLPDGAMKAPWYAIGPSTVASLKRLGVSVRNSRAHTASELARTILEKGHRRVVFFAGDPHRFELPVALERAGVTVSTRTVYRSRPALEESLEELETPDWAVFFSPRGVQIVADTPGPDWDDVKIAAIGPTTADAVEKAGWNLSAKAAAPDAASLVSAIQESATVLDSITLST
jgi:uroporphyrinogen-III synthase